MRNSLLALALMVFVSCNNGDDSKDRALTEDKSNTEVFKSAPSVKSQHFRTFLKKFNTLRFPYIFRQDKATSADYTGLEKLDKHSIDTLFAKADFFDETYCLGMLSDTTNFYALVFLHPASGHYPVLATYTKSGEFIGQESLINGSCGADCGLSECSMTGIVRNDLYILSVDSIKYEYYCDSLDKPLPNSGQLIIIEKEGRIKNDGKLLFKKEKRTEINIPSK